VLLTLGSTVDTRTLAHQLGHNFGIGHANLDFCPRDMATVGCTEYEMGDLYDVMGGSVEGWDDLLHLNAATQVALGWSDAATPTYALSPGEDSRTWSVYVQNRDTFGGSTSPRAVLVVDPITSEPYVIESRESYSGGAGPSVYGQTVSLDGGGGDNVLFTSGVRVLHYTADRGSSVLTVPHQWLDLNIAAANSALSWSTGDAITNASGSVAVQVPPGTCCSGTTITITLDATPVPKVYPEPEPEPEPDPNADATPVYRFWSDRLQGHFYTISEQERDRVIGTWPDVWSYEGSRYDAFQTQQPGTVPLYRFWSERYGGHFYTVDVEERDRVIRLWPEVWAYEGVAYYVYPVESDEPGTVPVARFWSPLNSHHFYTADPVERDRVIRLWPSPIWDYEGDAFRVPFTG
jgi:hypothetical protein